MLKKLCVFILSAFCILSMSIEALAEEIPTVYCFTAGDFQTDETELSGVLFREIADDCKLVCGARRIRAGDVLTVQQLDQLQISANSAVHTTGSIVFLPVFAEGVGESETLYISLRGTKNQPPVAHSSKLETYKNLTVTGEFDCSDPEGDSLIYTLTASPKRGQVVFHRDGTFSYTPNREKVGEDAFTYVAEDTAGNCSEEVTVAITILKPVSSQVFADMTGDPQEFEALFLKNNNIFSGEMIGGTLCFRPEAPVSREEFLMMAMALTGLSPEAEASETGQDWFSPWQTAALRAGLPAETDAVFTRSDAEALTAAILRTSADSTVETLAGEDKPLTRREAAVMLYTLHRHCEDNRVTLPWQ